MEEKAPNKRKYDVFISYRHEDLPKAVAAKLERMLEGLKHPAIREKLGQDHITVFRDEDELPIDSDLTRSLQLALESSRYLAVILTPDYRESKYCLQEIQYFKELHGGSLSRVLVYLADGKPEDVIPEDLRWEIRDGVRVDVEPLWCDLRANSIRKSLRKLSSRDYLRIAAPVMGVAFDDLYQRRLRQQRMGASIAIAALTAVLCVITGFAIRTYRAERRYLQNLTNTYAVQGTQSIASGDPQSALLYFSNALKLDRTDPLSRSGSLLLLQQLGWLNHLGTAEENPQSAPAQDSPDYGTALWTAPDGSCVTCADGEQITFMFHDEGTVIRVPCPQDVNPMLEDLSQLDGFDSPLPNAMALTPSALVVEYAGYLYLYRVERGAAELKDTFDLAELFQKHSAIQREEDKSGFLNDIFGRDARRAGFSFDSALWVQTSGELIAVNNGYATAIFRFDGENTPELIAFYERFDSFLNDVAFCPEGYALCYGNGNGILSAGGCVEVYSPNGVQRFATDYDKGIPLDGAVFEPGGERIAVWGSGEVHIWDITSGSECAAYLATPNPVNVLWQENGELLVYGADGVIDRYEILSFTANATEEDSGTEFEKPDTGANETALSDGLTLQNHYTRLTLVDGEGKERCTAEETTAGERFIVNQMLADPNHGTAYLWHKREQELYAVTMDPAHTELRVQKLESPQQSILAVYPVWNGILVETANGGLFYYEHGGMGIVSQFSPEGKGSVEAALCSKSGTLCLVLKRYVYPKPDSLHFNILYNMELWDLSRTLLLAKPVTGSTKSIKNISLSESGLLCFEAGGQRRQYLLDAAQPNETDVSYLRSVTCLTLGEDQKTTLRKSAFLPEGLGGWAAVLTAQVQRPPVRKTVETLYTPLQAVLDRDGPEAWVKAMQDWWAAPTTTAPNEIHEMFSDCFSTARDCGQISALEEPLKVYLSVMVEQNDTVSLVNESWMLNNLLLATTEFDEIIGWHKFDRADRSYQQYEETSMKLDLYESVEHEIDAYMLLGDPKTAYEDATSSLSPENKESLDEIGLIGYRYLTGGEPVKAAEVFSNMLSLSEPEDDPCYSAVQMSAIYLQRGILSEQECSAFISHLPYWCGLRLNALSQQNLVDGLRLNDVVLAVNDLYFGHPALIRTYMEKYPGATLTVLRGDDLVSVKMSGAWQVDGIYTERAR